MKLRSIVFGLLLALASPLVAFAQCSGQAPAHTHCANPTASQALAGWKPLQISPPQHRISLAHATPVMSANVAAASTVYVVPAVGNLMPISDGTNTTMVSFDETSQATTDATKSPAAAAADSIYDIFCWVDSVVNRCTRSAAWTVTTPGSAARGYTLTSINGILVNTSAIINGPAALRGTWVGTIATNGSATVDYIFGGSGTGGVIGSLMVWNVYNQNLTFTSTVDTGTSYTYTSNTPRVARASSGNQIRFVIGAIGGSISCTYSARSAVLAVIGAAAQIGCGIDSIASFIAQPSIFQNVAAQTMIGASSNTSYVTPTIGMHTLQAYEASDSANANNFNTGQTNTLQVQLFN